MGYELENLMKYYGLTTPNKLDSSNYSPTDYKLYQDEFSNRLKNTSMYGSGFEGAPLTVPSGYVKPTQTVATVSDAPKFTTPAITTTDPFASKVLPLYYDAVEPVNTPAITTTDAFASKVLPLFYKSYAKVSGLKNGGEVKTHFADGGLSSVPRINELNKLLQHYGVSSPTIAAYGGSTDTERGAYSAYVNSYKNRIKNTSMYGQGASDRIAPPTYATPVAPVSALTAPVVPTVTPTASTTTSAPVALSIPQVIAANTLPAGSAPSGVFGVNNTLTAASPLIFQGPTPLFSGIFGRAKGGAIDVMAEKYKLAKKHNYADGGSVDPLAYFYQDANEPDPPDDYPDLASMLSGKAYVPAVYESPKQIDSIEDLGQQYGISKPVTPVEAISKSINAPSVYGAELEAARKRATAETNAFQQLLEQSMNNPKDDNLSKAEMYFRLAAAFGSPTKTKQGFMEHLGQAGQQMSEYTKGQRDVQSGKLALKLKGQELRQAAAKEDLANVRALASEEMKDKRAFLLEAFKQSVSSNKSLSDFGKTLNDMGLATGSAEYKEMMAQYTNAQLKKNEMEAQQKEQQGRREEEKLGLERAKGQQMTPKELEMYSEAEDMHNKLKMSYDMLRQAFKLNQNSFTGALADSLQRKIFEAAGSDHPTVVNTREMENLLKGQALQQLKAFFTGATSNEEKNILLELQGIDAKSQAERAKIFVNAARLVQKRIENTEKKMAEIKNRTYGSYNK